jgi:hypothetical protein
MGELEIVDERAGEREMGESKTVGEMAGGQ